jgi:octaprenyl-diphosphate synthase
MHTLTPARAEAARLSPALLSPVTADLDEVERILARTLASSIPAVARLVDHVRHYRGKRLRPLLLLLTGRACGTVGPLHHAFAAVVELIHTASLVHDDVLDDARTRRHVRTANALWGNQASILLGDLLFSRAFRLASTTEQVRACQLLAEAVDRLVEGELRQVSERGNLDLDEATYFAVIDGKTAELTACCCRLGALLSGAAPENQERLARYGRWLGQAFQVADDLLDVVGEEQTTGKTLGTDLAQGKLTLPVIRLLERLPADQADEARAVLREPGPRQRERLAPYLAATGAVSYARRRAEELAARARGELEGLPPSESRAVLEEVTEWTVRREK